MGAAPLRGLRAIEPVEEKLSHSTIKDLPPPPAFLPPSNNNGEKTSNAAAQCQSELEIWSRELGERERQSFCCREVAVDLMSGQVSTAPSCKASSSYQQQQESSSILLAEQVVHHYVIQSVLGRGKYSHVLHIHSRRTSEEYALKVVQKLSKILEDGDGYQVEIGILSQCSHPNIVALHGIFHTRNKAYLFLELASGGDLFDRISAKGRFSEVRGRSTLRMILAGLSYLHDNGITHRDLKLENVLYKSRDADSRVLLADFGLAHVATDRTLYSEANMSATCGTPEYMSPEMLEGEEYCRKVDMWAVGVVSYVVLSGQMPFVEGEGGGGRGRAKLYQDIRNGEYSFTDKVKIFSLGIHSNLAGPLK